MTASISIDAALADPKLLGAALGETHSWQGWFTILRAAFGLLPFGEEAAFFASVAGERKPPTKRVREGWFIVGRRSGKSRMAAAIASYLATVPKYALSPGEVGHVLVLAASKSQARTVFDYSQAFLQESPILRQQVVDVTADEIRLAGNISISVHTNNYKTVRGRTLLACIFDEVAFWRDETTSLPDVETYRAVLPALATTKGMLIGISSPYATRGLLFQKHRDHFGKNDDDVLVIRAGSTLLNPTLDDGTIQAMRESDPEAARSEWDAEFRGDLSTFVDREIVERCIEPGVRERPPMHRWRYTACDPSGGQHDSMCLAISHREGERVVLDATFEAKAPFEPGEVIGDIARLLDKYRVRTVRGDRYSGQWVPDAFRKHGISYTPSDRSKSEIYLDCLPLLTGGTALLLDDRRLVAQLSQLERRTSRTGRDSVDHMRGASDDLANAVAGALTHTPSIETRTVSAIRIEGAIGWNPLTYTYKPFHGGNYEN